MRYGDLAPSGPPRPLTREEVREVDRRAIEELGVPGVLLMENAGLGATAVVEDELVTVLERVGAEVAIVCGRGNNGGDGLVVARHLALRGHHPRVAYAGPLDDVDPTTDAGVNLTIARRAGIEVVEAPDGETLRGLLERWSGADLVVDALYGTGLASELREPGRALVEVLAGERRPVVAIDVPSGLDADAGAPLGLAVKAVRTATFVAPKVGFDRPGAAAYTGRVEVVSIGCPAAAWSFVT